MSRSVGDIHHQSLLLGRAGQLKNWRGEYAEGARFQSEGLRIALEHNLPVPRLNNHFWFGITLIGKGDYDAALGTLTEGLALSEKLGDEVQRLRLLNSLGWLYGELGDLHHALDFNRRGAEEARKRGNPETIANAEINLGDVFQAKGDLSLARELLDGVHRLVKNPATSDWNKWRYSMHLFASLGELWLAKGDPTRAREFAEQCLALATPTNSRKYLVKAYRLKGEIALARHQWDEAEDVLRQALTMAETIGNPTELWRTYLAIGRLYAVIKKPERARQAFQSTRAVIDRVKAGLQNPELRASLENSALIRRVYDVESEHDL
jgi:tetratricopeptide (TPR) repeat protein